MSETATPNSMPGAITETPAEPEPATTPETVEAAPETPEVDLAAEVAKWKEMARRNEKTAKSNAAAAKKLEELEAKDRTETENAIKRAEAAEKAAEDERLARIRSEVARTEGVDPEDITGVDEDEMRASAARLKAKIEQAVQRALKGRAPAAAPAGDVTSNGKVAGPSQIKSRDELKNMTSKEIMAAQKEGRLDHLMGKP
jgi:hypothetical protein